MLLYKNTHWIYKDLVFLKACILIFLLVKFINKHIIESANQQATVKEHVFISPKMGINIRLILKQDISLLIRADRSM